MPLTPEQEWTYWDTKATEIRHGQLQTVQKAASGWSTLFGAVLGVFGTVAFAGGLTTLDKLAEPWDVIVKVGTMVAVAAAILATYWAAKASQDLSPVESTSLDATTLRERNNSAATVSLKHLTLAKRVGILAALIVVAGSALILWAGEAEKPSEPPTAIAIVDGKAVCGKVGRGVDGALSIDGIGLAADVTSVIVVNKCP